ncbi:universal stress protein [Nocardioides panacihumi]|uniref:Universal stress protein n=1 Tax=Nocardioides panacihumi TaxID=400774 RepID=A0ABP5D6I4_9ACTN
MGDDWILVGVDGTEGGDAAVRYAAREAAMTGSGVKLLHVAPELAYPVALDAGAETAPPGQDRRERVLVDAAAAVRAILGDAPADRVVTMVEFGGRTEHILEASRGCRLVVLGDRHRPLLGRLATGSVHGGVVSRAQVPVVVVPASTGSAPLQGRMIAAVKSADEWRDHVGRAMGIAKDHGARLVLLHAWDVPVMYDDLVATRALETERRAQHELRDLRAGRDKKYVDLPVEIKVVRGQAAKAIVDASAKSDLVILTRRSIVAAIGHLGGTARTVLRESRCPVLVLPPPGLPDFSIEERGELLAAADGSIDLDSD